MADFLSKMAVASEARLRAARAEVPDAAIRERSAAAPEPVPLELGGFDLIAELKRRSPAAGGLAASGFDPSAQLAAYAAGGAAAVSVLTEPTEFNGSLDDLRAAAEQLRPAGVPVMRKDFSVDPYQVHEARAAGASGVLLIAAMLSDAVLAESLATAQTLGLFVLLEAFDEDDLARIGKLDLKGDRAPVLVGVNSRNLKTLAVDFERFAALAERMPRGVPAVAESGINDAEEIRSVAERGYTLALVGSALMRNADVAATVGEFIAAGRATAGGRAGCS
ncbi:MAG: indole-3-glycerol phosphate synthase TrpC [Gammaproteobacteria bacterium]|nr:indole-3-glycerol phosphate synthase TrpC [Gammaproteobacteria bacterium]